MLPLLLLLVLQASDVISCFAAHVNHQLQLLPAFSDTPDAGAPPNKLPPEDLDPLPGKLVPWILRSESVWWSCSAC